VTGLCGANFSILLLYEGDVFRNVAMYNVPPAFAELRRRRPVIRPGPMLRVAATKRLLHITDITKHPELHDGDVAEFVTLTGARTILAVPMLKGTELTGVITIYRTEVQPFAEQQIGLVQNFAAQAVIAIENAHLLNELRQRTSDLTEALEQQTAASEVLRVVSRSPGDLEPAIGVACEAPEMTASARPEIATANIIRSILSSLDGAGADDRPKPGSSQETGPVPPRQSTSRRRCGVEITR
jgi:two-component system NtrC family sensor kinase